MIELKKELINSRMLKNNGSWLYCDNCGKTVGYLVYSTYQSFRFKFDCKCGSSGSFDLSYDDRETVTISNKPLSIKKNRRCCPNDDAPLFSIVEKNLENYSYEVVCNKCFSGFEGKMGKLC